MDALDYIYRFEKLVEHCETGSKTYPPPQMPKKLPKRPLQKSPKRTLPNLQMCTFTWDRKVGIWPGLTDQPMEASVRPTPLVHEDGCWFSALFNPEVQRPRAQPRGSRHNITCICKSHVAKLRIVNVQVSRGGFATPRCLIRRSN